MPLIETGRILQVLNGYNPWWTDVRPPAPPFRRVAVGLCQKLLAEPAFRRAILLSGPRRVGKTTMLLQSAEDLIRGGQAARSVFYCSLDHPLLKLVDLTELLRLYHEMVHPAGASATLLLDEIQCARDWESHVKVLVDHHPEYRIIATGSASLVHKGKLAESGTGRWHTVPVPTLSFYEFLRLRGTQIPEVPAHTSSLFGAGNRGLADLARRGQPLRHDFNRYLLLGGFPETAQGMELSLAQRLLREDVVDRVLKRDMTSIFGIRKIDELERLFLYLCINSGSLLSVQRCAKELQTTAATVTSHLTALEHANLVYRLAPVGLGGKTVLRARNKYYLVDAALRNAVLLRGEEILSDSREMGLVVETAVLRHLFAFYYRDTPVIGYWRDARTEKEVDLVVKTPRWTLPVEVKYREDSRPSEADGLAVYCRAEKVRRAFWITRNDEDLGVVGLPGCSTEFLKIPAHLFCCIVGQAEQP